MTAPEALALLAQAAGIVLLRHRLGKTWLRRPVTLLGLASVLYQGLSAVLLTLPALATYDTVRRGISPEFTTDASLLTSAAMLGLLIAYLMTQPQRALQHGAASPQALAAALDWRLFAAASVPLAVLTYQGKGYTDSTPLTVSTPLSTDLAATFFLITVVLAAFGLVLLHGSRWFLPALIIQSLLLAAAGERLPVLTGAVALGVLLTRVGMRPTRASLHTAAALTLIATLAIMGARTEQGRGLFYADRSLSARAGALAQGVSDPQQGLIAGTAARLDGNAFAGGILQAEHVGYPQMSSALAPESLLITIPSVLWPSKVGQPAVVNTYQTEIDDFGLQQVNFLPTLPGLYTGFLPWPLLLIFMAGLGAVFGWAEQRLMREAAPGRLVLLAGAVMAAGQYEAGLPAMLVTLRAAAVTAGVVWVLERARSRSQACGRGTRQPILRRYPREVFPLAACVTRRLAAPGSGPCAGAGGNRSVGP
jgi:hypothetical protein